MVRLNLRRVFQGQLLETHPVRVQWNADCGEDEHESCCGHSDSWSARLISLSLPSRSGRDALLYVSAFSTAHAGGELPYASLPGTAHGLVMF